MVLTHSKISASYIKWKCKSRGVKISTRKYGEIFQAFHVEKSKILAMCLFTLKIPGRYFKQSEYQFFAIFRESDKLSCNFCYNWNFLTRPECKVCNMRHTLGYINIFEYLHPEGTFLCRNFCNTLKIFYEKKNQILCLLGADTETIYMELQTPYIRLKRTSV